MTKDRGQLFARGRKDISASNHRAGYRSDDGISTRFGQDFGMGPPTELGIANSIWGRDKINRIVEWIKPMFPFNKINTDASVNSSSTGAGRIICNQLAIWFCDLSLYGLDLDQISVAAAFLAL
ncbi:hypothetical protein M5K25_022326 [Dendrobium thyrsiflorum]|uniref:Uncharacterized protein n=1 Tax=Dendrobium thyrsiflorum TaxID=117978 RepID=A0ABD0U5Y6_DENTH